MRVTNQKNNTSKVAVFLALFYAFSTRSIVGPIVFRSIVPLLFYLALYVSLAICFVNSFRRDGSHIYAPRKLWSLFLLFLIIAFGLDRTGDLRSLLYYGIPLLLPFAVYAEIKEKQSIVNIFIIIGIILTVGCVFNYVFPIAYRAIVIPLFSETTQNNINWQLSYGTSFPGFTSQVGYTSFFLSVSVGALFAFRKNYNTILFWAVFLFLIFGLFLTGKRGPFAFLTVSIMILYFIEGYGRDKIKRVFQIIGFAILGYLVLYLLATYTSNPSIDRIFDTIREFILTRDVEDAGREQLWHQAIVYFESYPISGIGWTNFKNMFTLRKTHVHNIYLQLLCETGIIGFILFAVFFLTNIFRTVKKIRRATVNSYECSWLMLSFFIQTYFLLYGISGNPLYDIEETILYFFAIGISMLPMSGDMEQENDLRAI